MGRFEDYQQELAPPWHRTRPGAALNGATGAFKDDLESDLIDAVQARFPRSSPEDGLSLLGDERRLPRFPDELTEAYRARLTGAFEFWQWAGTLRGLTLALEQLGYVPTVIEHFRTDPAIWAEFSVVLYPGVKRYGTWRVGRATVGDGKIVGLDITPDEAGRVRSVVGRVKPAHTRLRTLSYAKYGKAVGGLWFIDSAETVGADLTPL